MEFLSKDIDVNFSTKYIQNNPNFDVTRFFWSSPQSVKNSICRECFSFSMFLIEFCVSITSEQLTIFFYMCTLHTDIVYIDTCTAGIRNENAIFKVFSLRMQQCSILKCIPSDRLPTTPIRQGLNTIVCVRL